MLQQRDSATFWGLLAGGAIFIAAFVLAKVPLSVLLNPEAWLLIVGGTATALLVQFSWAGLQQAWHHARWCFYHPPYDPEASIQEQVAISRFIRSEGLLALDAMVDNLGDKLLSKGLRAIVEQRSAQELEDMLTSTMQNGQQQLLSSARVFEAAGGFAPTMGILGAVLGLIHVMSSGFVRSAHSGEAMAGAFSATLFGVALSNCVLLPMAGKLKDRARALWQNQWLVYEGLMSLHANDHPIVLEEKLRHCVSGINAQLGLNPTRPEPAPPVGLLASSVIHQAPPVQQDDDAWVY